MRAARTASFVVTAALPVLVVFSAACGGGNAAGPGAATPASAGNAASNAAAAPNGTATSTPPLGGAPGDTGAPSTTTATLADGGELQGSKLQQASGGAATMDVDAGPARGVHGGDPGRSQKDIQTIIQAHRDEARACYDRAQQQHPDVNMKGNLDVKWTIDPQGNVTDVTVDQDHTDIHDAGVQKCVMDVVKAIHFSVSGKGFETHAHYPFNFNPKFVNGRPASGGQQQP